MNQSKLVVGIMLGLILGTVLGYTVATSVHSSEFENSNISDLMQDYKNQIEVLNNNAEHEKEKYNNLLKKYNELESNLDALDEELDKVNSNKEDANIFFTINGKTDKYSETFTVEERTQYIIKWNISKSINEEGFHLSIYDVETGFPIDNWFYLDKEPMDETFVYLSKGTYYLGIKTIGCIYEIKIIKK